MRRGLAVGALLAVVLAGCLRARPKLEYEQPVTQVWTGQSPPAAAPAAEATAAPAMEGATEGTAPVPEEPATPKTAVPPRPSSWKKAGKW